MEEKLRDKDSLISEPVGDNIQLKKIQRGSLKRQWVELEIRESVVSYLESLQPRMPSNMFGQVEPVAEYDPVNKMRIRYLSLNLRSSFKLEAA